MNNNHVGDSSMSVIHVEKVSHFSAIDNALLEDKRLSFGARGLLCYLLSKPDSWEVNINHLIAQSPTGRDYIYARLSELQRFGYAEKTYGGGKTGWVIREKPDPENPTKRAASNPENPDPENPDPENPTLVITETTSNTERESNTEKNKVRGKKIHGISLVDLPEDISSEVATEFIQHRKLIKKPLTQKAFDRAMKIAAGASAHRGRVQCSRARRDGSQTPILAQSRGRPRHPP